MPERFLAVKGFRRFQHYRDRNPVWIKLYTDVLVDPGFDALPEAAQAQLIKIWIFRAQFGTLPNDPKFIAGKIGARGKFHVAALVAAGFLVPTDDPIPVETATESASDSGKLSLADSEDPASTKSPDLLANPEENATRSVRADARSRESESGEGETTHSLPSDAVRLCAAANKGLAEHAKHPQAIPRIHVGQGSTVEAMEILRADGVPIDFAESAVYEAARSHTSSKGVSGLKYFASRVVEQWQLKQSSGPSSPRRAASADLTDRARLILTLANAYGLCSDIGNRDDYNRRRAEAAADPRAFPEFLEITAKLDLAHGIGSQPEPFALKELVRRLESAPANGVPA